MVCVVVCGGGFLVWSSIGVMFCAVLYSAVLGSSPCCRCDLDHHYEQNHDHGGDHQHCEDDWVGCQSTHDDELSL